MSEPAFPATVSDREQRLYHAALQAVSTLIALDPAAGSPEGQLLAGLAAAVEDYERARFPEFR